VWIQFHRHTRTKLQLHPLTATSGRFYRSHLPKCSTQSGTCGDRLRHRRVSVIRNRSQQNNLKLISFPQTREILLLRDLLSSCDLCQTSESQLLPHSLHPLIDSASCQTRGLHVRINPVSRLFPASTCRMAHSNVQLVPKDSLGTASSASSGPLVWISPVSGEVPASTTPSRGSAAARVLPASLGTELCAGPQSHVPAVPVLRGYSVWRSVRHQVTDVVRVRGE
jgi:hypothetical protein